jgi:serine/threonine-protein kinase RsbW
MVLAVPVPTETPMYWRRDFPGEPDQVRVVRAFAAHLLAGFPALDDVLLVLNELVVNALHHTRSGDEGGRFTVEMRQDVAGVTVCVADEGGPGEPCLTEPSDLAESGRGLLTVDTLAAHWSWTGDARGRTLRATFAETQICQTVC